MISAMVLYPWMEACGASGLFGVLQEGRVRLLHHLFAEVHEHQVVLEDTVVEHELGRLAEVDDPFGERRRVYAVGHVLRIDGADGVVVAADPGYVRLVNEAENREDPCPS